MKAKTTGTATAGLRGAYWDASRLPANYQVSTQLGLAADGVPASGLLYSVGGERTAVLAMHPREFLATHYLVPEVLRAGAAIFLQIPRANGSDLRLEHETTVFEIGAGVSLLRELGFEKVLLLGNSGGGPVMALYNQQSLAAPQARLARTAAGRPIELADAALPPVDGLLFVSSHEGPGVFLQECIDGALTDEADPYSVDPSLSLFNPKNGFRRPPESASYTPEFLERYRVAQKARVARIDATARAMVEERVAARKKAKEAPSQQLLAQGAHQPVIQVWRTDADPRCYDLNQDPSDRSYGSVWGPNPVNSNFGVVGFARLCTPESWLSTWSANSCVASMQRCAPSIEQPTLLIEYTGDNTVFPQVASRIASQVGARDKLHVRVPGNHHGASLGREYPDGREMAGRAIAEWLKERFPLRADAAVN